MDDAASPVLTRRRKRDRSPSDPEALIKKAKISPQSGGVTQPQGDETAVPGKNDRLVRIGNAISKLDDLVVEEFWDLRSPTEQILWSSIWLVVILLCVISTYLGYVVLMHNKALNVRHESPEYDYCEKPSCLTYASEYLSTINYSVDPCDDFQGFACGISSADSSDIDVSGRHFSDRWIVNVDRAARILQDIFAKFDSKDDQPHSSDYEFMRSFYSKCKDELFHPNLTLAVEGIRAVLRRVGLARWPMLEVDEHLNIFDVLRESFLHLGFVGLFTLEVRRDLMYGKMGHQRPYTFHIGPPELYLPKEFLVLSEPKETEIFEQYNERMTKIARAFRIRIELTGIAREIIMLQYYLNKMFLLKPSVEDYYLGSLPLQNLSTRDTLTDWHNVFYSLYGRGDYETVKDVAINVWSIYYLEYLSGLFSDPYIKRALVNYIGWLIVDRLGHITFKHQHDFYLSDAPVLNKWEYTRTCAMLAIKMAPATSAKLVFQDESFKRTAAYVLRIANELRAAFTGQINWLAWMDQETKQVAFKKIKAMTIEVFDGATSRDEIVQLWNEGSPFVGIELDTMRKRIKNSIRWLHENSTKEDCLEYRSVSPFSTRVHYIHWCNKLLIPIIMIHNRTKLTELPPVYAFSTIGAMVSIKFMEAIMFTGAFINHRLELQDWHSESTKTKFSSVVNCTANNVDQLADRQDLFRHNYPQLLEELTLISGGLSLAFKGYLIFMAKYEEEFVDSNNHNMKLTLKQYFFLQFAMNFCKKKTMTYVKMFNVTDLDDKFRIVVPMQNSFRMSRDFVCSERSVLGNPNKCSVI